MGAIADAQGSVQMLIDLYPALGEAITPRGRGNLPPSVLELDAVIVPHGPFMLQSKDTVELIAGVRDESSSLGLRADSPGPVMERDPGALQEGIRRFPSSNSGEAELLGESALPGFPEALHAAAGLR